MNESADSNSDNVGDAEHDSEKLVMYLVQNEEAFPILSCLLKNKSTGIDVVSTKDLSGDTGYGQQRLRGHLRILESYGVISYVHNGHMRGWMLKDGPPFRSAMEQLQHSTPPSKVADVISPLEAQNRALNEQLLNQMFPDRH